MYISVCVYIYIYIYVCVNYFYIYIKEYQILVNDMQQNKNSSGRVEEAYF